MTDFPDDVRGSTRLLEAWDIRTRHVVSDSDIKQTAARLDESSGELAHVVISGGWQPPIVIKNGQPAFERLTVLASLGVLPANAWDAVIPQYRLGAAELLGRQ